MEPLCGPYSAEQKAGTPKNAKATNQTIFVHVKSASHICRIAVASTESSSSPKMATCSHGLKVST